jgi:hypothetical protein
MSVNCCHPCRWNDLLPMSLHAQASFTGMNRVHPPQIGPKTSLSLGSSNPETSLSGIDALEGNGRREAEGEGLVGVGVALACGRWPDQLRVVCHRLHSRVPSRLAQTRCDYAPARPARQGRKQTPSPHPTGCVSRRRDAREATPASQADVAAVDNGRAALPLPLSASHARRSRSGRGPELCFTATRYDQSRGLRLSLRERPEV